MVTATTPAAPGTRQGRARALCVACGAAAAAIAWAVEVPLLGIRLSVRFGAMPAQTVAAGQVAGVALAAGLLGWLLLAVLERRTPHARSAWVIAALVVLALSLTMPMATATSVPAAAGLIVLHLAAGTVVIPGMARTSRGRNR